LPDSKWNFVSKGGGRKLGNHSVFSRRLLRVVTEEEIDGKLSPFVTGGETIALTTPSGLQSYNNWPSLKIPRGVTMSNLENALKCKSTLTGSRIPRSPSSSTTTSFHMPSDRSRRGCSSPSPRRMRPQKSADQRPIAAPADESIVISPVDAIPEGVWAIDNSSRVVEKSGIPMKTGTVQSVEQLIGGQSRYKGAFAGGTFTHLFLDCRYVIS
jgi:hypothetical protein